MADFMEEQKEERQREEKENVIIYQKWAMTLLTVIQYISDVVMAPIRSFIFGPQERQSFRSQNMEEEKQEKRTEKDDKKTILEEKAAEEQIKAEQNRSTRQLQAQEISQILNEYTARMDVAADGKQVLYSKEGTAVQKIDGIQNLDIHALEKIVASTKNLATVGKQHDFDKLSVGIEAVILQSKINHCIHREAEVVGTHIATSNGVYDINILPVYKKSKTIGEPPTIDRQQIRLQIVKDGKEIHKGYGTQELLLNHKTGVVRDMLAAVEKDYQTPQSTHLQLTNKTAMDITLREEGLKESSARITLTSVDEKGELTQNVMEFDLCNIAELKKFIEDNTKGDSELYHDNITRVDQSRALAEMLSMTFAPREIVINNGDGTHHSALDNQIHNNRDSYAYIQETPSATNVCYSYKIPQESEQSRDVGKENVHTLLSVSDMSKVTGQQFLEAYRQYVDLQEKSYPIKQDIGKDEQVHSYYEWQHDTNVPVQEWNDLEPNNLISADILPPKELTPTQLQLQQEQEYQYTHTQEQTYELFEQFSDCVGQLCDAKQNGKSIYKEAYPETIYYKAEEDVICMEVVATRYNNKSCDFTVDINMNEENNNGKGKYYISSDNRDIRFIAKEFCGLMKENRQLTDDFFHYIKKDALEKMVTVEQEMEQKAIEPVQTIEEASKQNMTEYQEVSPQEAITLDDFVSGRVEIPGYDIELVEDIEVEDADIPEEVLSSMDKEDVEEIGYAIDEPEL